MFDEPKTTVRDAIEKLKADRPDVMLYDPFMDEPMALDAVLSECKFLDRPAILKPDGIYLTMLGQVQSAPIYYTVEVRLLAEPKPVDYEEFATESLLSMTSGYSLCNFSDMHRDIEKLAGFSVWTHQLPRVMDGLKSLIIKQCPFLGDIVVDDSVKDGAVRQSLIESIRAAHGNTQSLTVPLVNTDAFVDPMTELTEMVGADRILAVSV